MHSFFEHNATEGGLLERGRLKCHMSSSAHRTALQSGAAPNLAAAGAALAAAFLRQGLAGSDTVVLGRLMALLCAPLKTLQVRSLACTTTCVQADLDCLGQCEVSTAQQVLWLRARPF